MRPELKALVMFNWVGVPYDAQGKLYGYGPHVDAVVAMNPTPEEKRELADLFNKTENEVVFGTLEGVMWTAPDPVYRPALVSGLDSPIRQKQSDAMEALLRGGYEGAWELLFSRPDVQRAMGDELADLLWGAAAELPEAWQREYLACFCERFEDNPPLNMCTRQWLRTLANISVTDAQAVKTLLRIWNGLGRNDHLNRYLVLLAMAAAPVREYMPMLKKALKSSMPEMNDAAKKGLGLLEKP